MLGTKQKSSSSSRDPNLTWATTSSWVLAPLTSFSLLPRPCNRWRKNQFAGCNNVKSDGDDQRINESRARLAKKFEIVRWRIFFRRCRLLDRIKKFDPRRHGRTIIHPFSRRRRKMHCVSFYCSFGQEHGHVHIYIYAVCSRTRCSFRKPSRTTRASITALVVYCRFMTQFNFLRPHANDDLYCTICTLELRSVEG